MGRLDTCYAPVRRSPSNIASYAHAAPRLACVKPVASVHPEPGSNSSLYNIICTALKAELVWFMTFVPDCFFNYPFGYWRFACTCFLYYNLCLCKSFKERAHDGALPESTYIRKGVFVSFAGAKVQLFWKLPKHSASFFYKKAVFTLYTLLYNIRARERNRTIWRMAHAKDIWQEWHKYDTGPENRHGDVSEKG